MAQRGRKVLGMMVLLVGLALYIGLAVTIGTLWLPGHWAAQLLFYSLAGIAWALPLKPLMAWMSGPGND